MRIWTDFSIYPRMDYENFENLWIWRLHKRLRAVLTVNIFSDITERKSELDASGGRRPYKAKRWRASHACDHWTTPIELLFCSYYQRCRSRTIGDLTPAEIGGGLWRRGRPSFDRPVDERWHRAPRRLSSSIRRPTLEFFGEGWSHVSREGNRTL